MKEKNLIASVALFSELYNSSSYTSIPDILAEFIRGAITHENKYSFTSTELKDSLKKVYGFEIPEAIVRTTLQNKFRTEVTRNNNIFHFNNQVKKGLVEITTELEAIENSQDIIIDGLYKYVEIKSNKKLSEKEKKSVFRTFTHFLMDNGYSDAYSNEISGYIISNELNAYFKNNLNSIREGLILYQGINFTADINEIGKWHEHLTIYLAAEHLFNALGYNGILYKEIFDDFYKLVVEINASNHNQKNPSKKTIELKFLEETKLDIENFFSTAEDVKKGTRQFDPSKLAMENIIKGTNSPSDIKAKKIKFDMALKTMGIVYQEFPYDIQDIPQFNVEDSSVVELLTAKAKEKNRGFNENECYEYFRVFTKINTFRNGKNNKPFEKIGHVFMTERSFAKYLAHNFIVKFGENDMSFVKDIDFITTRFWFALKKGFSDKANLPKSFDVVNKAKLILSGHINSSVSQSYEKLVQQIKDKELSREEALERSLVFREKPNAPEKINEENIDVSLDFLNNEDYIEDIYRERIRKETIFEKTIKEKEALENELQKYKSGEEREKLNLKMKQLENNKNIYANSEWKKYKRQRFYDLLFLVLIIVLNLFLIVSALLISISKDFKDWLCKFEILQLSMLVMYATTLVFDTVGYRYIFNREKIKSGWEWLKILFNYKELKHQKLNEFKE